MFGVGHASTLSPDGNNVVGIGIRGTLYAFSYSGKSYVCKSVDSGWQEAYATKSDLPWKLIGKYDLTTSTAQKITIPSNAEELLIFAGNPNGVAESQVYGGKSYIIPKLEGGANIVCEHEFYDASAEAVVRCGGFYAYWENTTTLTIRAYNPPVRVRVYYR